MRLQVVDIVTLAFALIFISGPVAMNSLTMIIAGIDKEILLALNSFAGANVHLWKLANNSLFRGFPLFFSLPALWFSGDHRERRGQMSAGLLAVCLATILSVWLQFHVAVHTRPILDPALHLQTVIPPWTWDRASSFPSDTATLFFGLAAVVFEEESDWSGYSALFGSPRLSRFLGSFLGFTMQATSSVRWFWHRHAFSFLPRVHTQGAYLNARSCCSRAACTLFTHFYSFSWRKRPTCS
jgi:hypothetical protein